MKLSVIVPVYNMAADDKLKWCMDSLVGQTISDYEIIAVDDCSTDDSLQILRSYEREYPQKVVVIASKENRKQGGAKNLGLAAAKGDWIGFIDADDWITPDFYEKLLLLKHKRVELSRPKSFIFRILGRFSPCNTKVLLRRRNTRLCEN